MEAPPDPGDPGQPALLVYDGDCPLCRDIVDWLRKRRGARNLRLAPFQGDEGRRIVGERGLAAEARQTILLFDADGAHSHSEAVRATFARLGGVWPAVAKLMRAVPRSWRDAVYDFIARRRYRL